MIDVASAAASAIARGSWDAPLWAAAAGAAFGLGPCAAARAAALAPMLAGRSGWRCWATAAAFAAGLAACSAGIGLVAEDAGRVVAASPWLYVACALALAIAGARELLRSNACEDACGRSAPVGAAFGLGGVSAALLAPCCTPLLLPILVYAVQSDRRGEGAALLAAFALGHALPTIAAVCLGRGAFRRIPFGAALTSAARTIAGAVMLGMGVYYGALA